MNYLFLTYLFAFGATLELLTAIFCFVIAKGILSILAFLLLACSGIHGTLTLLFYDMYKKNVQPNWKQISLTLFNIFAISSCCYLLYYILADFLGK